MVNDKIFDLNEYFNELFYKKFTFILDSKIIKSGRLKLFDMKGFNLKFFLIDEENNIKQFEIPYPFKIRKKDNILEFDYRLFNLVHLRDNLELLDNIEDTDVVKSRLYDKILTVKIE